MEDQSRYIDSAAVVITGPETASNTVSADILVRLISGIQQSILILAAANENVALHKKFRPTEELRQRYQLVVDIPQPGSYVLPLKISTTVTQLPLLGENKPGPLSTVHDILSAVVNNEPEIVRNAVPDSRFRERLLREILRFLPKRGEQWGINYRTADQRSVSIDSNSVRRVDNWLTELTHEDLDEVMTITGELVRIDFDQNKVFIRYFPTGREIECSYVPDIEDTIIEGRREPIQVTGRFILDQDGNPVRLTDVTNIAPIDFSPMIFSRIDHLNRSLLIDPALVLKPELDSETKQVYVSIEPTLGIHVFAPTRDQLVDELAEQLLFLWDTYAQEDPEQLTRDAQELKQALLQRIQETVNAA